MCLKSAPATEGAAAILFLARSSFASTWTPRDLPSHPRDVESSTSIFFRISLQGEDTSNHMKTANLMEEWVTNLIRLCEHPDKYAVTYSVQLAEFGSNATTFPTFLSLHLLHPAVIFQEVAEQAHSIILASGTLCPVESFFTELGEDFATRQVGGRFARQTLSPLEATHVIGRDQLLIQRVSQTLGGQNFKSDYATLHKGGSGNTWDDALLVDLGWSLVQLCKSVPGGVLIFLPSYTVLKKLRALWRLPISSHQDTGRTVCEGFLDAKDALIEEESEVDIEVLKARYNAEIAQHGSCVLLAVMRAKCSEGISFNDHYARGVVIVGIPYPNAKAAEVEHKKAFNNWAHKKATEQNLRTKFENSKLAPANHKPNVRVPITGDAWYNQEAFRSINQALGRCVRHPGDYGALFLFDARWETDPEQPGLLVPYGKNWRLVVVVYRFGTAVVKSFEINASHMTLTTTNHICADHVKIVICADVKLWISSCHEVAMNSECQLLILRHSYSY